MARISTLTMLVLGAVVLLALVSTVSATDSDNAALSTNRRLVNRQRRHRERSSDGASTNSVPPPPPPPTPPIAEFAPLSRPLEALRGMPYPTPPLPRTVFRYTSDHYTPDDVFLLLTLAGAVARHNAFSSGANASDLWPLLYQTSASRAAELVYWSHYVQRVPSVTFSTKYDNASATDLITYFAQQRYIRGAFLTALQSDSVDVCVSLAGITEGAICATEAHTQLLQQLSVPILQDLRQVNETLFLDQFLLPNSSAPWPFSTRFVTCQHVDAATTALSDWSILIGAVQLHLTDSYRRVLSFLRVYYPTTHFNGVFGWYPDDSTEFNLTGTASRNDAGIMASDWLYNGGVHASLMRAFTDIQCPSRSDPLALPDNRNKHTLALLFTDGDNLQADENDLLDARHWAHPKRGSLPIGWGLNPTLASTFPVVLTSYYEAAVPANDAFVAFSAQYAFPDSMSAEGRQRWAEITGQAMAAADMRVLNFIGNEFSAAQLSPLLNQWNIDGVSATTYSFRASRSADVHPSSELLDPLRVLRVLCCVGLSGVVRRRCTYPTTTMCCPQGKTAA